MKNRALIEQAKGILIGARGCGADTAFEHLTRAAQHEKTSLRAMAGASSPAPPAGIRRTDGGGDDDRTPDGNPVMDESGGSG